MKTLDYFKKYYSNWKESVLLILIDKKKLSLSSRDLAPTSSPEEAIGYIFYGLQCHGPIESINRIFTVFNIPSIEYIVGSISSVYRLSYIIL
jgi:hypothetical protein